MFTNSSLKYSGCVCRLSASDLPPFTTRSTSSTMNRNPDASVSSPVMASARSSGTPAFSSVDSSCVKSSTFSRGKRRNVLLFTQELSTLLNAGVPLDRALAITGELTEASGFRFIVLDVLRVVKGGKSLADSLHTHPEYFSELFVNMVRAGEASGSLAAVFERLSEFERTRDDLRSYIVSSMAYPCLLALVWTRSILILMNLLVSRFASVFEQSRIEMPLPTKMLVETSHVLNTYGWMGLIGLVGVVSASQFYIRTAARRLCE